MVDLSQTDTFDDWFFNTNETAISDINQSSSSSLPSSPVSSSNESSLPVTNVSSLPNNEQENTIKKRKHEKKIDFNEHKKSKQTPSYMRRNIRHLLTNDKLQYDTLTALKAEQDRLKRLEEINENYQQFHTDYTHTSTNNFDQFKQIPNEEECIVLDDDENEQNNLPTLNINSNPNGRNIDNDDSSDSDVQCVDDDTEIINDNLTKKLQRLHIDDRVNIPDENGIIKFSIK